MSNADWGTKRICPNCGARFYDLKRRPIVCPKCNAQIRPSEDGRRPMRGKKAAFIPTPKAAPIAAVDPVLEDLDAEDIELEEVVDEIEAEQTEVGFFGGNIFAG